MTKEDERYIAQELEREGWIAPFAQKGKGRKAGNRGAAAKRDRMALEERNEHSDLATLGNARRRTQDACAAAVEHSDNSRGDGGGGGGGGGSEDFSDEKLDSGEGGGEGAVDSCSGGGAATGGGERGDRAQRDDRGRMVGIADVEGGGGGDDDDD